jgi:CheY-like chemotaxis protein
VLGKILLAEDNADTREALRLSLEGEGYSVRAAANGDEAFVLQASDPADVLVTDLFMPERDGFETLAAFRKNFPRTKIIVISGSATRLVRGNYLDSARMVGADATLQKPVAPPDLFRAIARLLAQPGASA